MHDKQYILFFQSCLPCKGHQRSIILDPSREQYVFVPNSILDMLQLAAKLNIGQLKKHFNDTGGIIDSYIKLLLEMEFILLTDDQSILQQFLPVNTEWEQPHVITNSILTISELNERSIKAINALGNIGCPYIEIRLTKEVEWAALEALIIQPLLQYKIQVVHLYVGFPLDSASFSILDQLFNRYYFLYYFYNDNKAAHDENAGTYVQWADFEKGCGIVHADLFALTIPHYTEALQHNTCLNRKISIDKDGNIKNCPSMRQSFGNILDTTLEDSLNAPGFKKYWSLTKDQVSVCKDCEFRYICTDCRAYLEHPDDDCSKPLKCGYDPYTCQWADWSSHPMKQKAMAHYGMLPEQAHNP